MSSVPAWYGVQGSYVIRTSMLQRSRFICHIYRRGCKITVCTITSKEFEDILMYQFGLQYFVGRYPCYIHIIRLYSTLYR
jgi:hypothetical protein